MEWIFAQNLAEALSSATPDSRYVGGGLSLTLLAERSVERAERLIDLSALPLRKIEGRQGELRIGAQVTLAELGRDPMVQTLAPILREAAAKAATPAIRNQSTLGGELLARTRCPLFRDASNLRCSKRIPHSGCAVLEGAAYAGAILGGSAACTAPLSSELAVALGAMEAEATLLSPEGQPGGAAERKLPILDLYLLPGDEPARELALVPGELLTSVTVPVHAQRRYGYAKLAPAPLAPLAAAAVMIQLQGEKIVDAKVILGALSTKPWRATKSESVLLGQSPGAALFAKAAAAALEGASPRADSRQLSELGQQVVEAALRSVGEHHGRDRS